MAEQAEDAWRQDQRDRMPRKRFAAAARRHIAGDLHSAERVYRRVLAEIPDDLVALFALGGLLHQKGAIITMRRSV